MKKRVLLIEDDEIIANLIKVIFETYFPSVELIYRNNGNDGIKELKTSHYDLLILDLVLPDRSGTNIIDDVGGIPTPPIIIMSSMSDNDTIVKTRVLDIVAYIIKPINKDFISLVRSVLINVD